MFGSEIMAREAAQRARKSIAMEEAEVELP